MRLEKLDEDLRALVVKVEETTGRKLHADRILELEKRDPWMVGVLKKEASK